MWKAQTIKTQPMKRGVTNAVNLLSHHRTVLPRLLLSLPSFLLVAAIDPRKLTIAAPQTRFCSQKHQERQRLCDLPPLRTILQLMDNHGRSKLPWESHLLFDLPCLRQHHFAKLEWLRRLLLLWHAFHAANTVREGLVALHRALLGRRQQSKHHLITVIQQATVNPGL